MTRPRATTSAETLANLQFPHRCDPGFRPLSRQLAGINAIAPPVPRIPANPHLARLGTPEGEVSKPEAFAVKLWLQQWIAETILQQAHLKAAAPEPRSSLSLSVLDTTVSRDGVEFFSVSGEALERVETHGVCLLWLLLECFEDEVEWRLGRSAEVGEPGFQEHITQPRLTRLCSQPEANLLRK